MSLLGAARTGSGLATSEALRAKDLLIETAGVKYCCRNGEREERHDAGRAAEMVVEKEAFGFERTRPVAGERKTKVLSEAILKTFVEIN